MSRRRLLDRELVKRISLSVAFGTALFLLTGLGTARADDYTKCQDKLQVAQSRLDRDSYRRGPYSSQARTDQRKLNEAQNWCSSHHVFGGQTRNLRNGRQYPGRNQNSNGRDQDAYRDPRNYGPYGGPYGPSR